MGSGQGTQGCQSLRSLRSLLDYCLSVKAMAKGGQTSHQPGMAPVLLPSFTHTHTMHMHTHTHSLSRPLTRVTHSHSHTSCTHAQVHIPRDRTQHIPSPMPLRHHQRTHALLPALPWAPHPDICLLPNSSLLDTLLPGQSPKARHCPQHRI